MLCVQNLLARSVVTPRQNKILLAISVEYEQDVHGSVLPSVFSLTLYRRARIHGRLQPSASRAAGTGPLPKWGALAGRRRRDILPADEAADREPGEVGVPPYKLLSSLLF